MEIKINDVIHGFRVVNIRTLEDHQCLFYEMEHEKTGAQLAWLADNDDNKTFSICFKTIPEDDTGVFHICEHSVLNGSQKYPVREPFVDLLKTSMQTFLNAMTAPDHTFYPVSSRNDQDFLNLMDVYLDAVLHPLIHTNPDIFYQEGWHYEIRDEKDEPVYKGVVLNEMKGAFASVDETVVDELGRMLFPDNCYHFVSGGDPEHIVELSYEQFKATHARFYHPSNARIFLDGKVDIDAALAKMDSFFAPYEKEKVSFDIPWQKQLPAKTATVPYEIGAQESPEHRTVIALARLLCTWKDIEVNLAAQVLATALSGSNDAPLKKKILEKGLGEDVEFVVYDGIQQDFSVILVRNTDAEKKDAIVSTIHELAEQLSREGLNHETLKAILNQMEFHYKEKKEPAGVMIADASYNSWLYGGDPALYLNYGHVFDELRQKVDDGWFEQLLKEILLDEEHTDIVVAVPDASLGKKKAEKEAARLHEAKSSWGDDIHAYIERTKHLDVWQASEDTPEAKAALPVLKLSEINEKPEPFEPEVKEYRSVPLLVYPANASGIVYFNLYFSIAGIRKDDLPSLGLFTDLLLHLPTKRHTLSQLQELVRANIGSLGFRADALGTKEPDVCQPMIVVTCSVLEEKLPAAVDLVLEILQETVFEKDEIKPLVKQKVEENRQVLIGNGHAAAVLRAMAHHNADSACREYLGGYTSARFVMDLDKEYDTRADEFIDQALMYQEVLFVSSRLTASLTGEENEAQVKRLIDTLPAADFQRCRVHTPLLEGDKEGIIIPAQVGYCACAGNMEEYGAKYDGSWRVLAHMLTYGYMWNEIRVKGGAYGTGFSAGAAGSLAAWTYRDPSPAKSLETCRGAGEWIRQEVKDKDLSSYIIGTIASGEPLLSYGQKVRSGDARWFRGTSYEDRCVLRREILTTDSAKLEEMSHVLDAVVEKGTQVLIAPESEVRKCADMQILSDDKHD